MEKLGTDKDIREKHGVTDAKAWAMDYVAGLNANLKAGKPIARTITRV